MNLNDIDFNRNKILVKRVKGGVWGEKPLLRNTKRLIKAYLEERKHDSGALFTGKQGKLKRRRIEQLFKYYAKKAKLKSDYSIHCLRHSIATHLLDDGQSIEFVQDHLGHKNIQNTQIYSKISERKRKEVFDQLEYSRDRKKQRGQTYTFDKEISVSIFLLT